MLFTSYAAAPGKDAALREAAAPGLPAPVLALVQQASNPKISPYERRDALRSLFGLSQADRAAGLRVLVACKDEDIACTAARSLIRSSAPGAGPLIAAQVSHWSGHGAAVVISAAADELEKGGDPSLRGLASEVLRMAAAGVAPSPHTPDPPVGLAALMLAGRSDHSHRIQLTRLLQRYPDQKGLWLALASAGKLSRPDASLARSVYTNRSSTRIIRVAAAIAAAPGDPAAAAFARIQVSQSLARSGDKDLEVTGGAAMQGNKEAEAEFQDWEECMRLVGMLRFLPAGQAIPLLRTAIHVRSPEIRMTAALSMVLGWPAQFLDEPRKGFPHEADANLLGLACLRRPELRAKVLDRLFSQELDEALQRLQKGGIAGSFFPGGSAVLVF